MIIIEYFVDTFQSVLNPLFYRTVVRRSALRAFGYYMFFTTVYCLAIGGVGLWWASENWRPFVAGMEAKLPPFEIQISEGHFSTTLPNPTVLGDDSFSLVIDTYGDTSSNEKELSSYQSVILLTKTRAVFKKNAFETREYNLAALPDFSLTSKDIVVWLTEYERPLLWSIFGTVALAILPMVWLFLIPLIFAWALLLLIPAKILRTKLNYTQVLAIAYYSITFPTLIQTYRLVQTETPGSSYLGFWSIYLIWSLVAIIAARGGEPPAASGLEQSTQAMPPHQA